MSPLVPRPRVPMTYNIPMSYATRNRQVWDRDAAEYQITHGGQLAESGGAAWGVWQIPESDLQVLGKVAGLDVLELGCGAAQWSIALHRLGARVIGLDNSAAQLAYARVLMQGSTVSFPLVHASAEATGLAGESFDIVFCDHGAMTFGDPYRTVPEASRLLRTGGLLAFSMSTPIADIAWPSGSDHPSERLARDYWELYAIDEPGEGVTFQLPYGTWIRLFRENALAIEDLIELRPATSATSSYRDEFDRDWARRWPMEHIWRVRKAPASRARKDFKAAL
jgi:SAM-dependent methyltransferase